MKLCKDCKGWLPEDDENFYRHGSGYNFSPYCKPCHRIRTYRSVQRQRARRREAGIPVKASLAVLEETIQTRDSDKYLDRHIAARQREAEIEASLLRSEGQQPDPREMSFADIKHHSLDPEPVFRDLTNRFLRPQTKVSSWKA
jgi:hypothetical protein